MVRLSLDALQDEPGSSDLEVAERVRYRCLGWGSGLGEGQTHDRQVAPAVLVRVPAPESAVGERLDRFVATIFEQFPTKSAARKAIERGEVWLNGGPAKPYHRMRRGDEVERREIVGPLPAPFEIDLTVHVEDEVVAIVEKPPGIPVVGNQHRTLLHALPSNLTASPRADALRLPRPVHRLDWPTGGLVVVAKTASALAHLSKSFENREVRKEYHAIVMGKLPEQGTICEPIDGRDALTDFQVLATGRSLHSEWLSFVRLHPKTGRKHQLRKHMLALGCPILGDVTYGEPGRILRGKGLFLWATGIELMHPELHRALCVQNAPPKKFSTVFEREQRRWEKFRS